MTHAAERHREVKNLSCGKNACFYDVEMDEDTRKILEAMEARIMTRFSGIDSAVHALDAKIDAVAGKLLTASEIRSLNNKDNGHSPTPAPRRKSVTRI